MPTPRRQEINKGFSRIYRVSPRSEVIQRLRASNIDIRLSEYLAQEELERSISNFKYIPEPISFEITTVKGRAWSAFISQKQEYQKLLRAVVEFMIQRGDHIPYATYVICNTHQVNVRILPNAHDVFFCFGRESRTKGGRLFITTRIPKGNYSPQTLWANFTTT